MFFICLIASISMVLLMLWYRYFLLDDQGKKIVGQTGTVRTNCVDCLDRTNVTQVQTLVQRCHVFFTLTLGSGKLITKSLCCAIIYCFCFI